MFRNIANSPNSFLSAIQTDDVQPNAVDIRLDRVFRFVSNDNNIFIIDELRKSHAAKVEMQPDELGYWRLEPGSYEVQMEGTVTVGDNQLGWVITRSTLNRNGVFLTSGLYDSGYTGAMAGMMHVMQVPMLVARGTRIGQFILADSEALHSYNGSYGLNADGTPKADEAVYHNKG